MYFHYLLILSNSLFVLYFKTTKMLILGVRFILYCLKLLVQIVDRNLCWLNLTKSFVSLSVIPEGLIFGCLLLQSPFCSGSSNFYFLWIDSFLEFKDIPYNSQIIQMTEFQWLHRQSIARHDKRLLSVDGHKFFSNIL